ncbi:signal peptidase I [Lachnospiraceae bacterium HCP1S3_C3]|nr:signal peptidase I [Lachnospiraceae bacterium]MDD6857818.1 signal peptidase I [Lachnospiraceae bacterium]
MKKFLSIVENLLFIGVLSLLCVMLYSIHVNNSVKIFNYRFMRVLSNSMEPVLEPNDCIIIKEVPESELDIGDIITFVSFENEIYGKFNTHRIYDIGIDENTGKKYYVTKGDYFDTPDYSYVIYENVIGKYVRKIPMGRVISFLVTKLADNRIYFAVIIFPLILCLLTYINQLIKIIVFGVDQQKTEKGSDRR